MTEEEKEKVSNIIGIIQRNSITCQHCKLGPYCFFGYECLSENFKLFEEKKGR